MILGFGDVYTPEKQKQVLLFLDTPGYLQKTRQTNDTFFKHIMFVNLKTFDIQKHVNFRKDEHRTMMMIRLIKS